MNEYTPTTERVRRDYVVENLGSTTEPHTATDGEAEFDRWLAQVKADAWDEGFRTCDQVWTETADITTPDEYRTDPTNPYRGEK